MTREGLLVWESVSTHWTDKSTVFVYGFDVTYDEFWVSSRQIIGETLLTPQTLFAFEHFIATRTIIETLAYIFGRWKGGRKSRWLDDQGRRLAILDSGLERSWKCKIIFHESWRTNWQLTCTNFLGSRSSETPSLPKFDQRVDTLDRRSTPRIFPEWLDCYRNSGACGHKSWVEDSLWHYTSIPVGRK